MINMSQEDKDYYGISFILDNLLVYSPYGNNLIKKRLKTYKPSEIKILNNELEKVERYLNYIKQNKNLDSIRDILVNIRDINSTISRCKNGITLDIVELYEIKNQAVLMDRLSNLLKSFIHFEIEDFYLEDVIDIVRLLDPENSLFPHFHISSLYSSKLALIREEKRKIEKEINNNDDDIKTSELHKKRLILVNEESEEEFKVRQGLSNQLQKKIIKLQDNMEKIALIDFGIAKADFINKYGGSKPKIKQVGKIIFKNMFNPEVDEILHKRDESFTPLNITLDPGTTVITGANMGGKTIALKTLILNMYLAHLGFYVFADFAQIVLCDFINFIGGDNQSLNGGLSSFGAEILNLKDVLNRIKHEKGFIAFDEFARGTNPYEGRRFVKAIVQHMNKYSSYTVITSHYDDIITEGTRHYQVIGLRKLDIKKASELYGEDLIKALQKLMDYRLEEVDYKTKIPRDGVKIARLLGIDEELLKQIDS